MAVAAYAQYLGTPLLELAIVLAERGDLVGSTTGKVKDVEGEDYVFLAFVLAQADLLARLGQETEFWGWLSYFCRHRGIPLSLNYARSLWRAGEAALIITHMRG